MDKIVTVFGETITGKIIQDSSITVYIKVNPKYTQEELEEAKLVFGEDYVETYIKQPSIIQVPKSDIKVMVKDNIVSSV